MRLCFVLTKSAELPDEAALEAALAEMPGLGKVTWLSCDKKDACAFEVGDVELLVAAMPAPVPGGEADGAAERSLSGITGQWTLPEHQAHLVVVQHGDTPGDLAQLTRFTRVAAAVAKAVDAVGVYWGEGSATHHPHFFIDSAKQDLPLALWVGASLAQGDDRFEILSIGMAQLGLPDLLLVSGEMNMDVVSFFYDLLVYVARRGAPIPEGDTVGRTDSERLAVHYVKSPLGDDGKVWSVDLRGKVKKAKAVVKKKPAKKAAAKKTKPAKKPAKKKAAPAKKKAKRSRR